MNSMQIQIIAVALLTGIACTIPGIFLVLRGMALMSDAMSHALLPGIVLMFYFLRTLDSPLLMLGAALAGIMTALLIEIIVHMGWLKKDAAIGFVFPFFFSVGVLLISVCFRNAHLDTDMVLLGELVFVPFNRLIIAGIDWGPYALWGMGGMVCINGLLARMAKKELQLVSFDPLYSACVGFSPLILHYALMVSTSITAVAAFQVVGSIVVVALMIIPPSAAYLMTSCLHQMVGAALLFSALGVGGGYGCAYLMDLSIAGSIAAVNGLLFLIVWMVSSLIRSRVLRTV